MNKKEYFMKEAIKEAKKGIGKVNPNPLVGCVIVKNDVIISKGHHEFYGGKHAEINAIENAQKKIYNLKNSDIYITLEPCFHYGKTPPCVDRIIKEKFKNVFVGMKDPNPLVNSKSINKLKKNNIHVETNILSEEVVELNKIFIKYITKKIPYVALKSAITLDGFIAKENGESKWISNEKSRKLVHNFRNFYSSILVGANTIIKDNPRLTCRNIRNSRNPLRIILDTDGITNNKEFNIYKENGRNIIFTKSNEKWEFKNTEIIRTNLHPKNILFELAKRNIDSILIEGGSNVFSQFIDYSDIFHLFQAPKIFGKGIKIFNNLEKSYNLRLVKTKKIENNIYLELKRECLQE